MGARIDEEGQLHIIRGERELASDCPHKTAHPGEYSTYCTDACPLWVDAIEQMPLHDEVDSEYGDVHMLHLYCGNRAIHHKVIADERGGE